MVFIALLQNGEKELVMQGISPHFDSRLPWESCDVTLVMALVGFGGSYCPIFVRYTPFTLLPSLGGYRGASPGR